MNSLFPTVGVCGTGAMGQGIAQMAAQAGSQVLLFDAATERAVQAQQAIAAQWQKMLGKQRISPDQYQAYLASLKPVDSLQA
jgi:3-hydroxybutyryl-CoA dehydrogenase